VTYRRNDPRRRPRANDASDDNIGQLGVNTEGDLTIGLGNGLTLDAEDGSLGLEVAPGFSVDLGD
jgi:hypothetical protein